MLKNELYKIIDSIASHEKRYSKEAYKFINDAVNYTVNQKNSNSHVSAKELLAGISQFAIKKYSIFYEEIFKQWGIRTPQDVGNIVFLLIKQKVLGASPEDSLEDFDTDFDLFALARLANKRQHHPKIKVPKID
jgi:uncharacterized repeat protein (TIGR04138 family)